MIRRICSWTRLAALALVALALVASPAPAQVLCGPDGLDQGPCCQPAQLILPQFPQIDSTIKLVCWDQCNVRVNKDVCVTFFPPTPAVQNGAIVCGVYLIRVQVKTCGAAQQILFSGVLRAHYSRNWIESPVVGGPPLEVYRFLLNGDIQPSTLTIQQAGNNPCVVPPCFNVIHRVYYFGYIDYALDCQQGRWTAAYALDHECGDTSHGTFTARPVAAPANHPTLSYAFVGPTAGFVLSTGGGPISAGPIVLEDVRKNDWSTSPAICRFEEPIQQGSFRPFREFCPCVNPGQTGAFQYFETEVLGSGACGTNFTTGPLPTLIGPVTFRQKIIGGWTIPAVFPGVENLLLDFGNMNYLDGCTPPPGNVSLEYFEGVETLGGYPANTFTGIVLPPQFEDLGSSDRPNSTMIIGAPHVTWYILNLNLP